MYYLYLIENLNGRAGFGITTDIKDRHKKYVSHSGDMIKFRYVYGGLRPKVKSLEKTIKRQPNLMKIEDWDLEWFNKDVTMEDLKTLVDQLIDERHLGVELVGVDYDFLQDSLTLK
jgi:hypothetical protein